MTSGVYNHYKVRGKTYEEIYGIEGAKRKRRKLSKSLKGHSVLEETKQRQREARLGKNLSELGHKSNCSCCMCKAKRHERSGPCSEETKRKIGKANSRKKIEIICRGCSKKFKVHLCRKETASFHSLKCLLKYSVGKNNPNWRGGTTNYPYPFEFNEEFKTLIRERDNHICQLCSKTKKEEGRNLCVHHIYYDKKNSCLDEHAFTTLCHRCNSRVNFGREHWIKFFQLELNLKKVM